MLCISYYGHQTWFIKLKLLLLVFQLLSQILSFSFQCFFIYLFFFFLLRQKINILPLDHVRGKKRQESGVFIKKYNVVKLGLCGLITFHRVCLFLSDIQCKTLLSLQLLSQGLYVFCTCTGHSQHLLANVTYIVYFNMNCRNLGKIYIFLACVNCRMSIFSRLARFLHIGGPCRPQEILGHSQDL